VDMSKNKVTIFLITINSPQYQKTLKSIEENISKTSFFSLEIINNISPVSEACNQMIEKCTTPFFIQLDEDMILDNGMLELMLSTMESAVETNSKICQYVFRLRDNDLGNILGIKIYNYNIIKNYRWQNEISSDRFLNLELKEDGYEVKVFGGKDDTVGTHALHRTSFELFLKNITIGNKVKSQATSSDMKHFINMYTKSCLSMNTEDSFYRLAGLYHGLTNVIEENFTAYPVDTFSKLDNFFKLLEPNFYKNDILLYEKKVNESCIQPTSATDLS